MTDPRFVAWAIGRGLNPNFINDGTGIRCSDERAWFAYLAWEESSRQNEAVLIQNQAEIERLKSQLEQIDTVRNGWIGCNPKTEQS